MLLLLLLFLLLSVAFEELDNIAGFKEGKNYVIQDDFIVDIVVIIFTTGRYYKYVCLFIVYGVLIYIPGGQYCT